MSATRRVIKPIRSLAAFSTEPMRVDAGLQKAFLKSVKPVPVKDNNKEKKDASVEKKDEKRKVAVEPLQCPGSCLTPQPKPQDLFVKLQPSEQPARVCSQNMRGGSRRRRLQRH